MKKSVTLTISDKSLTNSRKKLKKIIADREAEVKELLKNPYSHACNRVVFLQSCLYDNRKWLKMLT